MLYAPIIGQPRGDPEQGGDFVRDPVKVPNFSSLMGAQNNRS